MKMLDLEKNTAMKSQIVNLPFVISEDGCGVNAPEGTVFIVRFCKESAATPMIGITSLYYLLGVFSEISGVEIQAEDESYFDSRIKEEVLSRTNGFQDVSNYEPTLEHKFFITGVINVSDSIVSKYDSLLGL
jgi:hypothetical protein